MALKKRELVISLGQEISLSMMTFSAVTFDSLRILLLMSSVRLALGKLACNISFKEQQHLSQFDEQTLGYNPQRF